MHVHCAVKNLVKLEQTHIEQKNSNKTPVKRKTKERINFENIYQTSYTTEDGAGVGLLIGRCLLRVFLPVENVL